MFKFSASDIKADWDENGYCYVRDGCDPTVLNQLQKRFDLICSESVSPEAYEYLPESNLLSSGIAMLRELTSSNSLTISRKNIMYYRENMNSPAHKDRKSLQYAVAIGIFNPPDSRLLLWPDANRDPNEGDHYKSYTKRIGSQEQIDSYLSNIDPVAFATDPGDVVIFPGNSMFHRRINPLGSCVYYLDFNAWGLDDRSPSMQERPSL